MNALHEILCMTCAEPRLVQIDNQNVMCASCGSMFKDEELDSMYDKQKHDEVDRYRNKHTVERRKRKKCLMDGICKQNRAVKKSKLSVDDQLSAAAPSTVFSDAYTNNCAGSVDHCEHSDTILLNRDNNAVCTRCGLVLADGVGLFEFGYLAGSPFHNRRGSYKIIYYFNEKLAQWSRRCPPPNDVQFAIFKKEASRFSIYGPPAKFNRRTIASICRAIGVPTMQEKWLVLLDKLRKEPGFEDVPEFPVPPTRLLNCMIVFFRRVLPFWFKNKDIDVTNDVKQFLEANPELSNDRQILYWISDAFKKQHSTRKSFPHNFMMREFLLQLQQHYADDPDMANCYDLHEVCHKRISRPREFYQTLIWKHIVEDLNNDGGADILELASTANTTTNATSGSGQLQDIPVSISTPIPI